MKACVGAAVRASRPVIRFRTTVIDIGCPGRVVDVVDHRPERAYAVSFSPTRLRGGSVIVAGLAERDLEPIK